MCLPFLWSIYACEGPEAALYSITESGYMDSELFYGLLNQLFIPRTRYISGPKLLILDGHRLHLDIKSIELCRNNFVHMYCLPPHTMHIFQPLDVVIFHFLKIHFSRLTQLWNLLCFTGKILSIATKQISPGSLKNPGNHFFSIKMIYTCLLTTFTILRLKYIYIT